MTKYPPNELSMHCIKLWRTITKVLASVGLVALFSAPYHAAFAQQALDDVIEAGRQLRSVVRGVPWSGRNG